MNPEEILARERAIQAADMDQFNRNARAQSPYIG